MVDFPDTLLAQLLVPLPGSLKLATALWVLVVEPSFVIELPEVGTSRPDLPILSFLTVPKSCELSRGINGLGLSTNGPAGSLLHERRNFNVGDTENTSNC